MSLQTIFSFDKLKELLDEDTFTYYLRTHVDFVVVNTTNYLPIIAFEKTVILMIRLLKKKK